MTLPLFHRRAIALCTILLVGLDAIAQDKQASNIDTAASHAIQEVVVTAQYTPGNSDAAVQQIRVIGRKQIDAMGAQNLRDVLTNEPNIRLSQDNILGSSITLQGISGQNIKYLIDGVPIIGRQGGDIDLSQINLAGIQRIEIVKGPLSVSYGNNALGGAINLITKKGQQKDVEAGLQAYYESIGTYNLTGRVGLQKKRHMVAISGGRNYFDGWNSGDKLSLNTSAQPADLRRYQQWKPREQYSGDVQYTYRLKAASVSYKSSLFSEEITNKGLPRLPYGEAATDDHYKTMRFDNSIVVNAKAGQGANINFQAAYNQYKRIKNTYARDLTTLGSELSLNPGDQDTSRFTLINSRATLSASMNDKFAYEAGYDLNAESAEGLRIKNGRQQIADYAVFASAEYKPIAALTLRPGFRYAYNTRYTAPLTPSLNLRYEVGKHIIVRASYAKGFRAPDLKELYFYFVDVNHNISGNEHLQAESSNNFNLSLVYKGSAGSMSFRVDGNGFYNDICNRITLANITGTEYSYINIGKYLTHGGELTASLLWKNLSLSAGAACIGYYNELSEGAAVPAYSYSPEARGSVHAEESRD